MQVLSNAPKFTLLFVFFAILGLFGVASANPQEQQAGQFWGPGFGGWGGFGGGCGGGWGGCGGWGGSPFFGGYYRRWGW